jgi:hypothetical protein
MATWDDIRTIVADLPETVETAEHNWRVKKNSLAWERPLRESDLRALGRSAPKGEILGVRVADVGVKEALLADDPSVYFTTPHFDGYPAILVRLEEIGLEELEELVTEAWLCRAPKRLAKTFIDQRSTS